MSVLHLEKFGPAVDPTTRYTTAVVPVGTRNKSDDAEWLFVKAGGAITASGDPVSISTGGLSGAVRGDLDVGQCIGMAYSPFASGEYGYIQTKGLTTMVVESGAVAGGGLQISGTVGKLKAITTSGTQIAVMNEASDDAGTARKSVYLMC